MKFIRRLFTTAIIIALLIGAVYYFGTNWIADKAMNEVTTQLESSGQLESVKQDIKSNPEIQAYLQDAKSADRSKLQIQTKEQATRVVLKKFSISELQDIQKKAQSGMTAQEQQQLMQQVESRLTEEELLSLKVLALDELSK